jgi:DNA polymerase
VTTAVKHFKFVRSERGKRRLHKPPGRTEVAACRPWLVAELRVLAPELLVCLGSTAAKAVLGPSFKVTEQRGRLLSLPDDLQEQLRHQEASTTRAQVPMPATFATIHPSAALRAENREETYAGLVADLRVAAATLT